MTLDAAVRPRPRAVPDRTPRNGRAQAGAVGSIPLASWINVLSLDAVYVAVVWQALFARTFVHRWPRWHETATLALAVWLIYVGDRLLDARQLDASRPHLLRHRMHADKAGTFAAAWAAGCLAAGVVAWRWGRKGASHRFRAEEVFSGRPDRRRAGTGRAV